MKKRLLKLFCILGMAVFFCGNVFITKAASLTPENNTLSGTSSSVQTSQDASDTTVQKDASVTAASKTSIKKASFSKVTRKIYTGEPIQPKVTVRYNGKKLKSGTDYKIAYKNNKKIGRASIIITGKGNFTGTKTINFRIIPNKVKSLRVTAKTATTLTLRWKKVSGITGYKIYQYNYKTKKYNYVKIVKAGKTSCVINKLSQATTYKFKIKAYKKTSTGEVFNGLVSDYAKGTTRVKTPSMSVYSKYMGQVRVSWPKAKDCDGVELQYKTSKGKFISVPNPSNNKKTNTCYFVQLAPKTVCQFRLRAYVEVNGKKIYSTYNTKSVTISNEANTIKGGDYSPGSVYGPSLSSFELSQVRDKVQYFVNHYVDETMSDYMKVQMAHDYLCNVCDYADDWSKNNANSAWGALVYGEAQCSGYARAMKALCDAMGIGCYYVHANENASNPSHQWNEVKVNGKWYIIDVQCNDTSGFYAFFLVSDKTYQNSTGLDWNRDEVPPCPEDY